MLSVTVLPADPLEMDLKRPNALSNSQHYTWPRSYDRAFCDYDKDGSSWDVG